MNYNKKILIITIFILSSLIYSFTSSICFAKKTQTPILLNAYQIEDFSGFKIKIEGLVTPKTNILVYINKKYYSFAKISKIDEKINNFSYLSPVIDAKSFEIMLIAQNKTTLELSPPVIMPVKSILVKNNTSSPEILAKKNKKSSNKETSFTPTLISPKNNSIVDKKLLISGLAKNNSIINLYIDNILVNSFSIENSPSGISNFSHEEILDIKRGKHFVYITALNKDKKESSWSNIRYFFKNTPTILATSTIKQLSLIKEKLDNEQLKQGNNQNDINSSTKIIENTSLKINITIFILFLFAVLTWMFLINKEVEKSNSKREL